MHILWIPIFSMRSYDTGQYAICKDGNFQLTLARIMASDFDDITVVLPKNLSDLEEFAKQYEDLFRVINTKFLEYGANAVETRKNFWKLNQDFFYSEEILDIDLIITDITGYAGTMSYDLPFINNFNVTKLPELDRPYIDEFFEKDLENMEKALFTTVINPRQREHILEVAPHLTDKVIAYTKVAHTRMLPDVPRDSIAEKMLFKNPSTTIFWPFRISDKAYQFDKFYQEFYAKNLDGRYNIVITDPNDSFKPPSIITSDERDDDVVTKLKPTKPEYYQLLSQKPIVVMLDDIDTVLHPGTVEIMHYGCEMITLKSALIPHSGMVDSIDQIADKLFEMRRTGYNAAIDTTDFVYSRNEVSNVYNQKHIQCLLNS